MIRLLFIIAIFISISCTTSKHLTDLEPFTPENSFFENGKTYAYLEKDSVIVSIGFSREFKDEYVFDLTIDNNSASKVIFDPTSVYLFCYDTNNTLSSNKLHLAQNPDSLILELNKEVDSLDRKVRNNTILSAILDFAYIGAEIAFIGSDVPEINRDLVRVSHAATRIFLDEKRFHDINELENISYARCRIEDEKIVNKEINPGEYHTGEMYFSIPKSPYYKIYVPVEENIYSFRFKSVTR